MTDAEKTGEAGEQKTEAPFQGLSHEQRESFGEYVRLEADPSDPTAGGEPGTIRRANRAR